MPTPRLRVFGGPNGSGKTTIIQSISDKIQLGFVVNADDIEKELAIYERYSLVDHQITAETEEIHKFFNSNGYAAQKTGNSDFINEITISNNQIHMPSKLVNSYIAGDIAGFLRKKHLENLHNFTFETVLSHPSKLDLLTAARKGGYRIYLYYIATERVEININRVAIRVSQQGHSVPESSIRKRFNNSLELLYDAIKLTDRAYIFDNSGMESVYVAEITGGEDVELHCAPDSVPDWFITYVVDKSNG